MNIALIGYRGTGKSSVGRLLAERLSWRLLDTDDAIVRRAGLSIADIFEQQGEDSFRDLESSVLTECDQAGPRVVSLGGGAVLRAENRAWLARHCRVVWLTASVEQIQQRIAADPESLTTRPNLTAHGGSAEITQLLRQREPLYHECAQLQVDTEQKSVEQVAQQILDWWSTHNG